jgi:HSP20 family protein
MASLIRWNPKRDLRKLNETLNRYLDRFLEEFGEESETLEHRYCSEPPVESFRQNGSFVVKMDIPGVDPKDVHLSVEEGCLSVEGERKRPAGVEESTVWEEDVCYGPFRRTLHIPQGIKAEQIEAKYHDGILEITAPVEEKYLPKKIEVQVEKV